MAEANAVQGRKEPVEVDVGSANVRYCNVCPDVKATSFCEDCHEYMCNDCTGYHKRITATRNHMLLSGDRFPTVKPQRREDKLTAAIEKCPDHPKEEIKFYCHTHNTICCVACTVLKHEKCSKSYIPDIAEDFKNGNEFRKLNANIKDSERQIIKSFADIDTCLKAVDALKVYKIEKLRTYKAKIIDYLNKRERELQAEIQNICDNDVALLQKLQINLKVCQSDLADISPKLKLHEQNSDELFIAAKRAFDRMTKLQSSMQNITDKIGYQRYSVVMDIRLQKIAEDKSGFADIQLDMPTTTLKGQSDIQLGEETLDINDMTEVSGDRFLLTAHTNNKLVLLDSKTDTVLSEIALQDSPKHTCMVGPQLAATTLLNKKIQFIHVKDNRVSNGSILDVNVDAHGIAAHMTNLALTYDPPGVQIISKEGTVIHNLNNTTAAREVFKNPKWITTTSDNSIYVTDPETHTITRLDSSLTILQTFSGSMLKSPCGIISLNRNQILVCSNTKNTIVLIQPSSNSMRVILQKKHGIKNPITLCFCKTTGKLYIVPTLTTSVLVYKLT